MYTLAKVRTVPRGLPQAKGWIQNGQNEEEKHHTVNRSKASLADSATVSFATD